MQGKIVIGTPCYGGLLSQHYVLSILRLINTEISFSPIFLGHESLITRGRSTIVSMFMDKPEATHLLFIDADISFEPESIIRMLNFDKDFVAGMYPAKFTDWKRQRAYGETRQEASLVYVGELCDGNELKIEGGFATATYAGGGFQLIKRSVFQKMFETYPELKYNNIDDGSKHQSNNRYALFDCMIENGIYLSEDFSFCKRWRLMGGEIWLDLRSRLNHHSGSYNYCGNTEPRYHHFLLPSQVTKLIK